MPSLAAMSVLLGFYSSKTHLAVEWCSSDWAGGVALG